MQNDSVDINAGAWMKLVPHGAAATPLSADTKQGSFAGHINSDGGSAIMPSGAYVRKENFELPSKSPYVEAMEQLLSLSHRRDKGLTIKIYDIPSDIYELSKEIDVIVKYEGGEYLALFLDLELYGEGCTEFEAVRDLKYEIIDLADDILDINDENLGIQMLSWKKTLNKILRRT